MPDRAEFEPITPARRSTVCPAPCRARARGRRHDALLVDLDALQPGDIRTGGDDDVLVSTTWVLPSLPATSTLPVTEHLALAADDVDFVLFIRNSTP